MAVISNRLAEFLKMEESALASRLQLPPTFFCYKNRPGYVSEEEEDGESLVAVEHSVHARRSERGS